MTVSREVLIVNRRGLHARASAKFVTLASSQPITVQVAKGGSHVTGTSIMGLMMLGAAMGDSITIRAAGDGDDAALPRRCFRRRKACATQPPMREITAYSNPLVKHVRELRDKRHRRAAGQFLAEGLRILTEAREAGRLPRLLFFARQSAGHPLVRTLIAAVEADGGEAIETTADILGKLSGKDNPQAVVGVFDEFARTLDDLDRHAAGIWLVAERLRDPGNLGTILRTGDAVGAGGLILIGECVDPFSVEAVRASMGALFTIPVVRAEWDDFLLWLRAGPGQLVGLSLQTEVDYRSAVYAPPTFLLTGNEAQGLPEAYEAACDTLVKLPMLGKADSLNAAVATAVMAYEVLAQQRG